MDGSMIIVHGKASVKSFTLEPFKKEWKKIAKEDLMYEGKFFEMAWDLAFMFPMLEMAGG